MPNFALLNRIDSPELLRQLTTDVLPLLCEELRTYLLAAVSQTGGHLASGLGVIELTVALHYVFNTPNDQFIWDVGHQAYPHKILTQRRDQIFSQRKINGLSGFPCREESIYDVFGVGHAATSLSALLGLFLADQNTGDKRQYIAIIGDGAMTAGMAFEALHHIARSRANVLVIFNDNGISISPNIEGFTEQLSEPCEHNNSQALLNLFECLAFDYTYIDDGHDVKNLIKHLKKVATFQGPKLLHIKTQKGKGYAPAEADPVAYHGVTPFNLDSGLLSPKSTSARKPTFTDVFSHWLVATAVRDTRLMAITPAMREGSGLVEFSERFSKRYIDVGIAEQHAVTLAAGMACHGAKPVVAIYSTFLQRAYDQLIHDVALQNLDVLFAVDRAGVVGEDGATHAGVFDLAFARAIPNMMIMAPSDEAELMAMLNTGYKHKGPAIVRYPKGQGRLGTLPKVATDTMTIGKANIVKRGEKVAILVFGTLLSRVEKVAAEINATLVDMRFVKPLDKDLLSELSNDYGYFIIIEEGCLDGGIGEKVATFLYAKVATLKIQRFGIPDTFVAHGTRDEILAQHGLSEAELTTSIRDFIID